MLRARPFLRRMPILKFALMSISWEGPCKTKIECECIFQASSGHLRRIPVFQRRALAVEQCDLVSENHGSGDNYTLDCVQKISEYLHQQRCGGSAYRQNACLSRKVQGGCSVQITSQQACDPPSQPAQRRKRWGREYRNSPPIRPLSGQPHLGHDCANDHDHTRRLLQAPAGEGHPKEEWNQRESVG